MESEKLSQWCGVTNDLCSSCAHFRIVRNKAAEKVKEIGGYGPGGESPSPGAGSGGVAGGVTGDTPLLRHPAYSINNILGMTQAQHSHHQDANENILKRKRDDDGDGFYTLNFYIQLLYFQMRTAI